MCKKLLRKPVAMLLCAVMLMTCIPVTAFAGGSLETAESQTENAVYDSDEEKENAVDDRDETGERDIDVHDETGEHDIDDHDGGGSDGNGNTDPGEESGGNGNTDSGEEPGETGSTDHQEESGAGGSTDTQEESGETGSTATQEGSGGSGAPAFTDDPSALGSAESPISGGKWVYSDGVWKYMINGSPLINTVAWISYKGSDNKIYTGCFIFGRNGEMLTGWQKINGAWYYFSTIQGITFGMMMTGTVTPDGYTVGADGKLAE